MNVSVSFGFVGLGWVVIFACSSVYEKELSPQYQLYLDSFYLLTGINCMLLLHKPNFAHIPTVPETQTLPMNNM